MTNSRNLRTFDNTHGTVKIDVDALRAEVSVERWSGHGEGGETAHIHILGWPGWAAHNSAPIEIATAEAIARFINTLLKNWQPPVSK